MAQFVELLLGHAGGEAAPATGALVRAAASEAAGRATRPVL